MSSCPETLLVDVGCQGYILEAIIVIQVFLLPFSISISNNMPTTSSKGCVLALVLGMQVVLGVIGNVMFDLPITLSLATLWLAIVVCYTVSQMRVFEDYYSWMPMISSEYHNAYRMAARRQVMVVLYKMSLAKHL